MTHFASFLDDFLSTRIAAVAPRRIEAAFQALHSGYTSGSHETMPLRTKEELFAYIVARRPATFQAVHKVMRRVIARLPHFTPKTLLDIGSGPMTVVHAMLDLFPQSLCSSVSLESHPLFCQFIEEVIEGSKNRGESSLFQPSLLQGSMLDEHVWDTISSQTFDVACASYSLGELSSEDLPRALSYVLKKAPLCIAIEPGTPRGWKTLMAVREYALHDHGWQVALPCPHAKRCPYEFMEGAWCHEVVRLERTKEHRQLKKGTLGYEDEPFSYLVLARDLKELGFQTTPFCRVVNRPQHRSGHSHITLCTPDGELSNRVISRKQGELYSRVKRLDWGDEVEIPQ